jgi:hypothetical protein
MNPRDKRLEPQAGANVADVASGTNFERATVRPFGWRMRPPDHVGKRGPSGRLNQPRGPSRKKWLVRCSAQIGCSSL